MTTYHYLCANCSRSTWRGDWVAEVDCLCSIGVQAYHSMLDDHGTTWRWLAEDGAYYVEDAHGGFHWYDQGTNGWYPRGTGPAAQPEELAIVADAIEVREEFHTSTDSVEQCREALAGNFLYPTSRRGVAVQMIEAECVSDRHGAWQILTRWNTMMAAHRIAAEEVGLTPADAVPPQVPVPVEPAPEAQAELQVIHRNGIDHGVALFSDEGGYHRIFRPTGAQQMFQGVANDQVLIRIPRPVQGAPAPRDGARMGAEWENRAFVIPHIYNRATLDADGYYAVERVPHSFDQANAVHIAQVARVLTEMARTGEGPDFRPANVRFRANGQMVLIDFSENPGVRDAGDEFAALIQDFAQQFAAGDSAVYDRLVRDMTPTFRASMASALMPWEH